MQDVAKISRIMLVDDEAFDLKMYQRIITRSELVADVITFVSAEEALNYIKDPASPPVDLILLDINMPRMTGFEFMEAACRFLGDDFDIPVIMMLTTSMSNHDIARSKTFRPIKGYHMKPLKIEDIREAAIFLQSRRGEGACDAAAL